MRRISINTAIIIQSETVLAKAMFKRLFFLLLLLSYGGVDLVVEMQLSDRFTNETATSISITPSAAASPSTFCTCTVKMFTSFQAVPTTTTTVIKPTTSFPVPSPSNIPTLTNCNPCKRVDLITTPTVIFLVTTILLLLSTIILFAILLLTCKRMKKVKKQCKCSAFNAVFPDNTGVSNWISSDDVPTLSDNLSPQNDKKRHNIWSLSTSRPMTFESSSPDNTETQSTSPDHTSHSSKQASKKIRPKRKAPGPPVKAKKKKTLVPAGYIYPQVTCKQQPPSENANSAHVYDVPHSSSGPSWKFRLKKSTPKKKQEYQGIDISQVTPPGPYAELNTTSGTSTHVR